MAFLFRIGLAVAYILMAYFTAWLASVVGDDEFDRQSFSICLCIWWLVLSSCCRRLHHRVFRKADFQEVIMSKFYIRLKTMEIRKVIATSEEDALNKACESFGKENVIGLADMSKPLTSAERKEAAEIFRKMFNLLNSDSFF